MTDITEVIQSGSAHAWLYIPVAILLGALHGLEPGHSKTMMAAFIIAIRGTIWQAVLLGISAAVSHSLIIWVMAALALRYGSQWNAEDIEPWLQIASAVLILGLASWMFRRILKEAREAKEHARRHEEAAPVAAAKEMVLAEGFLSPERLQALAARRAREAAKSVLLDTGHGWLRIAVAETGGGPRFQIHPCKANGERTPLPKGTRMVMETARLDGHVQKFQFDVREDHWESTAVVPEPHVFAATLTMGHEDHAHTYRLRFSEDAEKPAEVEQPAAKEDAVYQDAHERAHAEDIERRFANRAVTTPQIVLFGITGGLMPCPAAFTILLVCLQLKRATLGFAIVGAFSFGLALTMVAAGVIAAWSVQRAQKRFSGFGDLMRKAPYVSCALLVVLAFFMAWSGCQGLLHPHAHGHAH